MHSHTNFLQVKKNSKPGNKPLHPTQRVLFVAFLSYVKIFVEKSTGLDACEEIKMFSIHFGHVFKNNSAKHKLKKAKMLTLELSDA